jgi:hypothetical protein
MVTGTVDGKKQALPARTGLFGVMTSAILFQGLIKGKVMI